MNEITNVIISKISKVPGIKVVSCKISTKQFMIRKINEYMANCFSFCLQIIPSNITKDKSHKPFGKQKTQYEKKVLSVLKECIKKHFSIPKKSSQENINKECGR